MRLERHPGRRKEKQSVFPPARHITIFFQMCKVPFGVARRSAAGPLVSVADVQFSLRLSGKRPVCSMADPEARSAFIWQSLGTKHLVHFA